MYCGKDASSWLKFMFLYLHVQSVQFYKAATRFVYAERRKIPKNRLKYPESYKLICVLWLLKYKSLYYAARLYILVVQVLNSRVWIQHFVFPSLNAMKACASSYCEVWHFPWTIQCLWSLRFLTCFKYDPLLHGTGFLISFLVSNASMLRVREKWRISPGIGVQIAKAVKLWFRIHQFCFFRL
jgi:hypothetical protein